jgi:hypothetical protein
MLLFGSMRRGTRGIGRIVGMEWKRGVGGAVYLWAGLRAWSQFFSPVRMNRNYAIARRTPTGLDRGF